ncbi:MAG: hypothetical protein HZB56_00470 [Deltaproteobacteria bacterium]|nr:hypothetical protein [Deltaproteobacteria bacterium]
MMNLAGHVLALALAQTPVPETPPPAPAAEAAAPAPAPETPTSTPTPTPTPTATPTATPTSTPTSTAPPTPALSEDPPRRARVEGPTATPKPASTPKPAPTPAPTAAPPPVTPAPAPAAAPRPRPEVTALATAERFLAALGNRRAEELAALCRPTFSFDGHSAGGAEEVQRRWREILAARAGPHEKVAELEILQPAEALARLGKPPKRLEAALAAAHAIALARVGGRQVALFLVRQGSGWAALGMSD